MGYDVDRFEEVVNDGLICCICRGVLEEPVQGPCEHAFCSTCIQDWLDQSPSCPQDRESLLAIELRPISRYMKNDLLRQRLRCRFTGDGCDHVCSVESIVSHEAACPFRSVPCPYRGCTEDVRITELTTHIDACVFRDINNPDLNQETEHDESADLVSLSDVPVLRDTTLDEIQEEIAWRLDERDEELQRVLDSHRHYIDCREAALRVQMEDLRIQSLRLSQKVNELVSMEQRRRQKEEEYHQEKVELLQLLRELQIDMRSAAACNRALAGDSKTEKSTSTE